MSQLFLELNIEIDNKIVNNCLLEEKLYDEIKKIRRKVFVFETSVEDEKYFKQAIANYLTDKAEETLTKTLWNAVWERNEKGKHVKYLNFNEYNHKLYLDRDFFQWSKLICKALNEIL